MRIGLDPIFDQFCNSNITLKSIKIQKTISIIILFLIIANQAITFALAAKRMNYANYRDDLANLDYSEWNSKTVQFSYGAAYEVIAASLTVFACVILILQKIANINVSHLIQYLLLSGVSLIQFGFVIWLALHLCEVVGPDSKNAGTVQKEDRYAALYRLAQSDMIITFIITIAGSVFLTVRKVQEIIGLSSSSKVESQPSTEVIKN